MKLCRYEAVFYGALALALMGWILFENALLCFGESNSSRTSIKGVQDSIILDDENRCLQLSDMRIPLVFVSCNLVLVLYVSWIIHYIREMDSIYNNIKETCCFDFLLAQFYVFVSYMV